MSQVFIIDHDKRPLNPMHPADARHLLKAGQAAVFRRYPFTLILKQRVPVAAVQPLRLKIDPGSKTTGIALLNEVTGHVVWAAELTHRGQQVKAKLDDRRTQRRGRRNRHTRYRAPRFANRTRPKGWLPPSLQSRIQNVLTWVARLQRCAPISNLTQELVRFDMQLMQDAEISGVAYQQGELQGYEVREYRALEPMFVSSLQGRFRTTNRGVNSLRPETASLGVGSLWIMYQKLKPMSVWCYPCGSWLRKKLLYEASLALVGVMADTPIQRVGVTDGIPVIRCFFSPSGVKAEPTSYSKMRTRESRNTYAPFPAREAKMPAWGQVDGGGVVVKCSSVMGETGRRSARESLVKTERETNGRDMVDAGLPSNRNRPHRKANHLRTANERSTGKRSEGKLSRSVWKGGKTERSYLSLLLEKWHRCCVYCGAKDVPLQVEHIIPRARGGTDRVSNLTLACEPCNHRKGTLTAAEFGFPDIQAQAKAPLKDAAAVNTTRWALYERLQQTGLPVETGTGGRTKWNRTTRDLPKTHWLDAACVGASTPEHLRITGIVPVIIAATGRQRRQMCLMDQFGFPRTKSKGPSVVRGFRTGDMAKAIVPAGTKRGTYVGRIAVRKTGTFTITTSTITGQDVNVKYLTCLHHMDGYSYQKARSA